jgi:hypothetical protein
MKRLTLVFLLLTFCATAFAGESQLQKATNVMNEIMSTPDKGIPHDLLDKAVCVGIVPSEIKFAFGFGGTYGRGVLVCRKGGNGQWDAPSMFTMGGASVGFQIGGKATDVVFPRDEPGRHEKTGSGQRQAGRGIIRSGRPGGSFRGRRDRRSTPCGDSELLALTRACLAGRRSTGPCTSKMKAITKRFMDAG